MAKDNPLSLLSHWNTGSPSGKLASSIECVLGRQCTFQFRFKIYMLEALHSLGLASRMLAYYNMATRVNFRLKKLRYTKTIRECSMDCTHSKSIIRERVSNCPYMLCV
jgi:hypothetical protein